MSEKVTISYEPAGTVRFETDPDGTLHIMLPAQGMAYFGIKSRGAAIVFVTFLTCCALAPVVIMGILLWSLPGHADLLGPLLAAAVATPLVILLGAFLLVTLTMEKIWIDASPAGLRIRRQVLRNISQQTIPRENIRGLELAQTTEDMHWVIRIHKRYESELLFTNRRAADLREVAKRLREVLGVPETPAT